MRNRSVILILLISLSILFFCPLKASLARAESSGVTEVIKKFKDLSFKEKTESFDRLSDDGKQRLLESLSEAERREWQKQYPDLKPAPVPEEISPPVAEKPEKVALSGIEELLSGQFPTEILRELRQFGYDFFKKEVSAFTPIANVPVGPDYIIGPGDSFTIHLWGKAEETYKVTVTRDGRITLPRLGTMNVSSLTFAELKSYLFHKFKEYYPDFEMSITMDRLRTVEIFIVGEAKAPGTYSVSSLSTVITALFAAGGPTKNGSLRNIKLFRNEKLFRTLDLYDFFIKGTKVNDIRLQPGDTIFIPVVGPVVGVAGYVKRPAIYEIKGKQTIGDLFELAGGVLPVGHLQNVVVERLSGHQRRIIRSFNLDPSYDKKDKNLIMPLRDFDVIKIYPLYKGIRQVVYLEGHVKYPREYELKPGMKLSHIIPSYDCLLPEPYLPQSEIIRLMPPDLHPEIIEFNLGDLLSGDEGQDVLLKDQDRIRIYSRWEKKDIPEVTIRGSVRNPGVYRLYKGMTIKDLIFQAGNFTDEAYLEQASLSRIMKISKGSETLRLSFSPQNALAGISEDNLALQDDDRIYIREIPQYREALERKVFFEGEFVFPGEYTFSEGERISSVLERADGLTEESYPFGAIFLRESVREVQKERLREYIDKLEVDILTVSARSAGEALDEEQTAILGQTLSVKKQLLEKLRTARPTGRIVINLQEVLVLPSSVYNFELKPGDRLIVNKRPDYVNVMGEVYNPTALFAEKDRSVGHYLHLVGGITNDADKGQIYVVKADGSVISKSQGGFWGLGSWDSRKHRWTMGSFESIKLNQGDTIIVPKKVEKLAWLRLTKDISQVLYQIAITAGVLKTTFGLF
ncbi:MAG: SLBB domain-containing protein [Deltaproteobacteria bacterium]|nr:SLBB domain-containing protein [Deltaproteobacteria bacterium]